MENDNSNKLPMRISIDKIDQIVNRLGLIPSYRVHINKVDGIMITEHWSSEENRSISVDRIFKFTLDSIKTVDGIDRKSVLKDVLNLQLEIEDYESAALTRDAISVL